MRAGYRGDAMITLIEKLRRQSQLEEQLMGEAPDAPRPAQRHCRPIPRADERLAALRGLPASARRARSAGPAYLAAIDGMSVDDPPEEGFVRGPAFLHPTMRLAFDAPRDFRLYNDQDGVLGVGRDRSLLYFSCTRRAACRAGSTNGCATS